MRINMLKIWCRKSTLRVAMLLSLILAPASPVLADPEALNELQAVNDRILDSMRGGYTSSAGLEITFGIETAVFIDGILQSITTFNSISPVLNLPDSRVIGQNTGLLSTMDAEAVNSRLVTTVQNSQDHKIINTITQINATVSCIDLYRKSNFMSSLQHQLIDAR